MPEQPLKVTALITVEARPGDGAGGFVVRALLRSGSVGRDLVGPDFVPSVPEVRQKLLFVCEILAKMVEPVG